MPFLHPFEQYELMIAAYESISSSKEEALEWILRNQLGRRNLSDIDRIKIANRYKEVISKRMKERQVTSTGGKNPQLMDKYPEAEKTQHTTTRKELAKIAGVGEGVLRKGTVILEKGTPEQIERARKGGKGNSVSAMLSNIDEDEKQKIFTNLNNAEVGSNTWFLTEDGLYEVLMQSRKPMAKQFKKNVKEDLKMDFTRIINVDTALHIAENTAVLLLDRLESEVDRYTLMGILGQINCAKKEINKVLGACEDEQSENYPEKGTMLASEIISEQQNYLKNEIDSLKIIEDEARQLSTLIFCQRISLEDQLKEIAE